MATSRAWTDTASGSIGRYVEDDGTTSATPFRAAVVPSPPGAPSKVLYRTATRQLYRSDTASLPLLSTLPALPAPPAGVAAESGWIDGAGDIWCSAGTNGGTTGYAIYRWSGGPSWIRYPSSGVLPWWVGPSGPPLTITDGPGSSILWSWAVGSGSGSGVTRYTPSSGTRTVMWDPLTTAGGPGEAGTCHYARWVGSYGLVGVQIPGNMAKSGIWKFSSTGATISGPHRFGLAAGHYVQQIQRDQTGQWWALIHKTPSTGYIRQIVRFDPATMTATAGPFTLLPQQANLYGGPILSGAGGLIIGQPIGVDGLYVS